MFVTTYEFEPTIASRPMRQPAYTTVPIPIWARSSITTGAKRFSNPSSTEWPMLWVTITERMVRKTSRPISTGRHGLT